MTTRSACLPASVCRRALTNVEKGAAANIQFRFRAFFIDDPKQIGNSSVKAGGIEVAVIRYHRCMIPEGETERLILRPLVLEDAERIQQIFPHWEVVRYLNRIVPWPYPANGSQQYLKEVALPAMDRGEEFHWTLRLKSEPHLAIGTITLRTTKEVHRGFWLGSSWHGQGLMMEAATWANDFWFETLGQPVLRVDKAVDNVASRRISEKQCMRLVAVYEKEYVAGRLPSETWEITADEWRACKRRS